MQKAVVDSVLKSAVSKVAEEIGALVGDEFRLSEPQYTTVTKAEFFETPREKCAHTRLKASSKDLEGEAAVILPLKDAIFLGGTLIMLPDDELAEKAKNPDLQGEEGDAFGEIANILAGSVTSTFEELFPKKLHFVKIACENLIPTKVDMEADEPFPPGHYHVTSCAMSLAGKALGNLELIFPFALLGLPLPETKDAPKEAAPTEEDRPEAGQKSIEKEPVAEQPEARRAEESSAEERRAAASVTADTEDKTESSDSTQEEAPPAAEKAPAAEKKGVARKVVDNVLDTAFKEIAKDLSDLIGRPVKCAGPSFEPVTKEEYLALPREKGALAHMVASGDTEGAAYIIVRQKDAIFLGGTLIMLPEDELATKVKACDFAGEEGDAYGEVANIITGSLAKVFGELYPRSLHFKRTNVEPIVPTKVDPQSDKPFAPGEYYLATCKLALEGKALGEFDLLFPVGVLNIHLETAPPETTAAEGTSNSAQSRQAEGTEEKSSRKTSSAISNDDLDALRAAAMNPEDDESEGGPSTVIVLSESGQTSTLFDQVLEENQVPHQILRFQDNIKTVISGHNISGIFIVMDKVDEQGFATAIKVKSAIKSGTPLIMAGPEWTRSSVIKAVRYGACDIIVTPASPEEISEKVQRHITASVH